ncbi:MAG: GIY-YIG nuclease family protein [Candidatus Bathyarchaeia archaeon]
MTYCVYVLLCEDGSYYTGYTTSLQRRLMLHEKGRGAKYTRAHRAMKIVHAEYFETRREAMKRERQIKRLPRDRKKELFKLELQ